jgi:hypothetical protein
MQRKLDEVDRHIEKVALVFPLVAAGDGLHLLTAWIPIALAGRFLARQRPSACVW